MSMCFELNGKLYCIPIPIVRLPWLPEQASGPLPDPWIKSSAISREIIDDLSVLAGINVLVKGLKTPQLQKQLTAALKDSIPTLSLPPCVRIVVVSNF